MDIVILSSGRPLRQPTYDSLPLALQKRTKLLVPFDEKDSYKNYPVLTNPAIVRDVTAARQWLVENTSDKLCMLDDDLTFAKRRIDNPTKFVEAAPHDIEDMFRDIETELDTYPHVGVASREGGNRNIQNYLYNTRAMRVLACRASTLRAEEIRYDRLKLMSDFDVTLQLLRKGYDTCVINWMVNNQAGSNAAGGCSQYRTTEMQEIDAHKLFELHPEFVKLSTKQTKQKGMWAERTDVTCYWKKARASWSS